MRGAWQLVCLDVNVFLLLAAMMLMFLIKLRAQAVSEDISLERAKCGQEVYVHLDLCDLCVHGYPQGLYTGILLLPL